MISKKLVGVKGIAVRESIIGLWKSGKENEVVLDMFMGSGSTALACKNTNRNYIGFEIDKDYYEVALKRVS